ncbi:uncharacterized protein CcaverHIS019_0605910 [Cutaneotrichosporon cavernicola]|uniref:Uncharacterized protein n=1 Tax=Cutaneotrichosporon cavernicola TaxID=279322 RepID=A0AA48L904_9TREE|nr:uncharacterized protein CcaverHIS019_0605910 [Cutaneotrichosporon cavernicola]BEI94132.1 hypothetical protein CcaverHIS019_0605910 [Cutaneotrichosporon cavernicola]
MAHFLQPNAAPKPMSINPTKPPMPNPFAHIWAVFGQHPPDMNPSWEVQPAPPRRVAQLKAGDAVYRKSHPAVARKSWVKVAEPTHKTKSDQSNVDTRSLAEVTDPSAKVAAAEKPDAESIQQGQLRGFITGLADAEPVLCSTRWRKGFTEEYCIHCGRNPAFLAKNMRVCLKPPKSSSL